MTKAHQMARKQRAEDDLRKAFNLLSYEIEMLRSVADRLASGTARCIEINNALVESFAIHIRVLIEFFYSEQPRCGDVIAEDFFTNPEHWHRVRPPKSEILKTAQKRAHKELAHLTYARLEVSPKQKPWKHGCIREDMDKVIAEFLRVIPKRLLGAGWDEFKNAQRDGG